MKVNKRRVNMRNIYGQIMALPAFVANGQILY